MTIFNYALWQLRTTNVCSNTGGYKTLAKNIPEFHKSGKIGFHFVRISSANSDLSSILRTNKAVYHHNRFSKYSDSKLKPFNEPPKKRKSTKDENGRKLTRLLAKSREGFIYSANGAVKRMLMLVQPCKGILGNKISDKIGSRERFNSKMGRNDH